LPWVSLPADEFVDAKEQYTPQHEAGFVAAAIRAVPQFTCLTQRIASRLFLGEKAT
jgi:hypothetical protein